KDIVLQLQLYKEVTEQQLNVKQLENRVHQLLNPEEGKVEKKKSPKKAEKFYPFFHHIPIRVTPPLYVSGKCVILIPRENSGKGGPSGSHFSSAK
ncbi:MAG: hypothetical protein Q4C70_15350, partial [Planctomycetia bacterium]|nr:hypothetical protein [Planctomycetia bacterium]